MDYFSELLDSFKKLKKRTYKLTYLTEADESNDDGRSSQEDVDKKSNEDAEAKADEVVKAGINKEPKEGEIDTWKNDGKPFVYKDPNGNQLNLVLGSSFLEKIADSGGTPDVNSRAWKRLVNYFLDGEDVQQRSEEDKEKAQEAYRQWLEDPKNAVEVLGDGIPTGVTRPIGRKLIKMKDSLEDLCASEDRKQQNIDLQEAKRPQRRARPRRTPEQMKMSKDLQAASNFRRGVDSNNQPKDSIKQPKDSKQKIGWKEALCLKLGVYFGAGTQGLPYQIFNAKTKTITIKDGNLLATNDDIDPALMEDVTQNLFTLSKYLTNPDRKDLDCNSLSSLVAYVGSGTRQKLVIFGNDIDKNGAPDNGIAMTNTHLLRAYVNAAKEKCQDWGGPINISEPNVMSSNVLNPLRANIDEKSLQGLGELFNKLDELKNIDDGSDHPTINIEEQKREIVKNAIGLLIKYVSEKEEQLKQFLESTSKPDIDGVVKAPVFDLDTAIFEDALDSAITDGTLKEKIKDYLIKSLRKHAALVRTLRPGGARDASKEGGTGSRADTVFTYPTGPPDITKGFLEKLGIDVNGSVFEPTEEGGENQLDIGQKAKIDKFDSGKIGELNTTENRRGSFREERTDTDIDQRLYKTSREIQFPGLNEELEARKIDVPSLVAEVDTEGVAELAENVGKNISKKEEGNLTEIDPVERFKNALRIETDIEGMVAKMSTILRGGIGSKVSAGEVQEQIGKVLNDNGFDEGFNSLFSDGVFKAKPDNDDEKVWLERRIEKFERLARMQLFSQAQRSDNPAVSLAAKDWALRNAIMCGGNWKDMIQVMSSFNQQKSHVFSHNRIFQELSRGMLDNRTEFELTSGKLGIGVSFDGYSCTLGSESTSKKDGNNRKIGMDTRFVLNLPLKSIEALSGGVLEVPKDTETKSLKNSTLHQYMIGQMKLLETLISQTNNQ